MFFFRVLQGSTGSFKVANVRHTFSTHSPVHVQNVLATRKAIKTVGEPLENICDLEQTRMNPEVNAHSLPLPTLTNVRPTVRYGLSTVSSMAKLGQAFFLSLFFFTSVILFV